MDGYFGNDGRAGPGLPLEDRIAHLDRLEGVFVRLADEFPANGRVSAQLDALRRAGTIFRDMQRRDCARFPRDFGAEIEEVRGLFLAVGARDADLESWGLV